MNKAQPTAADIAAKLTALTDDELTTCLNAAVEDLQKAAEHQHGSEWHDQCFAAVLAFSQEFSRRMQ